MRCARPKQGDTSVSLFPFLAVLLCTMGALIVVLLLVSQRAKAMAIQIAAQDDTRQQTVAELEMLDLRAAQLRQQREKTQADLAARRLELGQIEDHMRALQAEFKELCDRLAHGEPVDGAAADVQGELARTEEALETARRDLARAQQEQGQKGQSYAIVPYEGPHGTRRRPIYIECRRDAIVIQPEGIVFTVEDFMGPSGPGNPLAAAVRAAREHYAELVLATGTKQPEPYPLLLVRPDGVVAYGAARAALKSWDSEFGYELIDGDWKLAFEPADPKLAELERKAADAARIRQAELIRSAPRIYGGKGVARGRGGDFASAEEALNGGGPGNGEGSGTGSGSGASRRGAHAGNAPRGSGDVAGSAFGPGSLGGDLEGSELAGPKLGAGQGNGPSDGPGGGPGSGDRPFGADQPGDQAHEGEGGLVDGTSPNRRGGRADHSGDQSSGEYGDFVNQESANRGARGDQTQGNAHGVPGGQEGGTEFAAQGEGTSSSPGGMGGDPNAGPVSVNMTMQPNRPLPASMAQRRGTNWGLPEKAANAVPITRPIRVQCRGDRLILLPSTLSSPGNQEIYWGEQTEDAVDELVSKVWEQMKGWGMAGNGMYWKPILSCEVAPEARQRYEELAALLSESGLDVREKPSAPPSVRQPRRSHGLKR